MRNKKHIAILFLTILLFSNVGWSINVHYCGSHSTSNFSYIQDLDHGCAMLVEEESSSSCCDSEVEEVDTSKIHVKEKGCCSNELIKSTVSDQSIAKAFPFLGDILTPDTSWTVLEKPTFRESNITLTALDYYVESNAPPLYKLLCRLVLYA